MHCWRILVHFNSNANTNKGSLMNTPLPTCKELLPKPYLHHILKALHPKQQSLKDNRTWAFYYIKFSPMGRSQSVLARP